MTSIAKTFRNIRDEQKAVSYDYRGTKGYGYYPTPRRSNIINKHSKDWKHEKVDDPNERLKLTLKKSN